MVFAAKTLGEAMPLYDAVSSALAMAAVSQHPASRAWVCAWRSSSRGAFGDLAIFRSPPRHGERNG